MCGIFGYVSKKTKHVEVVLNGLKILEYRGYDSWGIAIKRKSENLKLKNTFVVEKQIGKIKDANLNSEFLNLNSELAIGHTRWATHGGVTQINAHPHLDCQSKISVVHNGIVENFDILKKDLLKKGHKFISATDSEVISHLIEESMKTKGFATAVRDSFNMLSGMNAIVVAYAPSSEIIAAKSGSPLVIGSDNDTFYIASDASSILPNTKKLLFLKDNQMAILGKKLQILSLPKGTKQAVKFETISWKITEANKGKYSHFMLKEIHEQPGIIRIIAKTYDSQIESLAKTIEKAKGTFFIGAGTASYAGLMGTYFFSKIAKKHVNMSFASEFTYLLDFLNKKSLIIALSQSGETIDVVEPLIKAQEKGSMIVAIVNTQGSTIYRMSDKKLLLGAGIEQAVASTKAFTAKISILLMLAYALKGDIKQASKQLLKAADEIDRLITQEKKLTPIINLLSKSEHIYIIGRGVSYPTSLEASLKVKEVSYIHTEGLAGGELKHGALALISKGTPCIVFAPPDETYESIISNATEIKTRGGVVIGISHKNHDVFEHFIEVKDCGDATAISQIVPIQLISYYLALKKGYDPDKPRNLAKSVTVK
ncbi:MAG TPA: glutamine--fructose-6-phosphate transaminase (isomerizing) [Candidatus Limnocylindrales bacterium]|nr:glutamine--fructose-6-phosphate transaminase (isomerizing) [Candidatus Limnocylindrales bacterium]